MHEIGYVEEGKPESVLVVDGKEKDFTPRFRESAYTPVKKVVDTTARDFEEMKEGVLLASEAAMQKKKRVLNTLMKKQITSLNFFIFRFFRTYKDIVSQLGNTLLDKWFNFLGKEKERIYHVDMRKRTPFDLKYLKIRPG